jgi:predicted permease
MAARLFSMLIYAYPASFRNEYGAEMQRDFDSRRRDCSSWFSVVLLWLAVVPDVIFTALREHFAILRQDVRYALRMFHRSPAFALTAVFTIALGVGANTAIFTAVDRVLVRPLPFRDPDRLVRLWEDASHYGYSANNPSPPNYLDWKAQSKVFEDMAAYRGTSLSLTGAGLPERLDGAAFTANLFSLLGVRPMLGRTFLPEEDRPDSRLTVVLSHSLWHRRFAGDVNVIGRTIDLDGAPFTVIGVMPPTFHFPMAAAEYWVAQRLNSQDLAQRNNHYLEVIARLRPGVTMEQAQSEMRVIASRLEQAYPATNRYIGVTIRTLREEVSARSRLSLLVLLAAAGCILLIGCSNLANLLLARASSRRKELSVRTMLGAGRERLIRQILTESILLSAAGGLAGLLLAIWTAPLLQHLIPDSLPLDRSLTVDWRVLGFGFALSLAAGVLFAILPALHITRESSLAAGTREGSREGVGGHKGAFRNVLVVGEIAVSAVLLVCAGLLVQTLLRIESVDPGFRPEGVLTLRTSLPMPKYDRLPPRHRFYQHVLSRVRALPGVQGAGYVSFLPLTMRGGIFPIWVEGQPRDTTRFSMDAMYRIATPGYFSAMGIPLLSGRDFGEQDSLTQIRTAIVSANFARKFWPNQNPLGRRFEVAEEMRTVVGVAGDVKGRGLERDSEPQVYTPYSQIDQGYEWFQPKDLALRTTLDPASLIPAVRRIIWSADPDQPISDVQTLPELLETETTAPRRLQLRLLGVFTGLALLLAAIGIYGLLSFLVSQRTSEIGVRLALGARAGGILGMFMRQGLTLAGIGLILGLAGAYLAGRGMERLLFGVKPSDPLAYAAAAILCLVTTLFACYLPARRASRIDPMVTVRSE